MTETLAERLEGDQAPAVSEKTLLRDVVYSYEKHFALALSGADGKPMIDSAKFCRVAYTAIRGSEMLQEATQASLMGALMACAQLGLEPSGPLEEAYLVPFRDKKNNTVEVQLILGYQGLINLAYRSGRVTSIIAHVVRDADEFEWELGTNAHIVHRPASGDRGEVVAAYAIANIAGGGQVFDVLSKEDIEARRAHAKTDNIWKKHYEAMARKSAIRQLWKWIPSSIENQLALGADGGVYREIPTTEVELTDPDFIDVEEIE